MGSEKSILEDGNDTRDAIRVLCVEDDVLDRELIRDALEKEAEGFVMTEATDRESFRVLLEKGEFDIVLTDFNILGFEGLEVIRAVRKKRPEVPVVVVTGTGSEEVAVRALKEGAEDYVIKSRKHIAQLPMTVGRVLEAKRTRDRLSEMDANFRALVANIADGITVVDRNGKVLFSNRSAAELLNSSSKKLAGEIFPYPLAGEGPFEIELPKKDGDPCTVEMRVAETVWSKRPCRIVSLRDVSDRKRTEEALRASHERFLTVMDSIDATVYVADMQTHEVLFMNKHMVESFGGNFAGQICWDVFRKESGPCLFCTNDRLIDEDGRPTGLVTWQGKNPITGKWYLNHDRAIEWTDGRLVRLQIATDITEVKKMEQELRQAQKLEAIGVLAGGIAHDFNNILSSIIGYSELAIEDADDDSTIQGFLTEIYAAGIRAKELVKQILAIARKSDEQIEPIRVDSIAKEVVKFIRSTTPTTVEIRQKIQGESMILGNPSQVHRILMNLLTNASQAMEDDGGVLDIRTENVLVKPFSPLSAMGLKPGEYLEIKVSDTGEGIAPEILGAIFEPYFTTKPASEGTGMGLAVVQGIVESYGGKVWAESEPGKGSVFTVCLPLVKKKEPPDSQKAGPLPSGRENILFVDDEVSLARMGKQLLERLGYSVTVSTDGVQALEMFREKPDRFDLVITDMTMPRMTGDKLAVEMMKVRPELPVVLCTGFSKKLSNTLSKDLGIKALEFKPIVKANLANTVRKVLDDAKKV